MTTIPTMTMTSNNISSAVTIAAISTPPGKGGVAVIRISGAEALSVAERIFRPRSGRSVRNMPPRVQIYGDIMYNGEDIDDGLATYFPAPFSYTGGDIIEISCHGGILLSAKVLESTLIGGARLAAAGEFTKRAFINGKLSLTDTEAIGLLLEAESEAQIKLAKSSSRSHLSAKIDGIRGLLVSLLSSIFARLDYPEEDLGELSCEDIVSGIDNVIRELDSLLATWSTGKAVAEGIKTVICGKPNVGKSTLYNALVGEDAAIVTSIPGTTRDVLERKATLGKVLLHLYDTAGIRESASDAVEAIGIERSRKKLKDAELIFTLFDATSSPTDEDYDIIEAVSGVDAVKLAIINKTDICANTENLHSVLSKSGFSGIYEISAEQDGAQALSKLTDAVEALFIDGEISIGNDAIVSSARQHAALLTAKEHLKTAKAAYVSGLPEDAAASDIELALGAIGELDGRAVSEAVVADIFSKFCVGK